MTPAERRQMMLSGPIVPTILTLAAPNVLNVAMQSLVSVSDGFFVGQLGIVDLAALALVFPSQMALGQMSSGAMGGGISSSVARAMGSNNRAAAEAAAAHGLVIAIGMAALFAIAFVGFGRQIYGALGGSGAALERAISYAHVLFLGCLAHWIANSMASVLRGTGDMKTPGLALVAGSAIQIPLTGALTLGWFGLPRLGIQGPATAAVICFTLSAIWMLTRLIGPKAALRLAWPVGGFRWKSFKDILKVGLVACLVVILTNGTVLLVTGLIGRAGDAAIAGYGIGSRLEYMRPCAHRRVERRADGGRDRGRDRPRRGDLARPLARPVHQERRRARRGPHLSQHRGPGLRLLWPGHGALLRLAGHRRDAVAGGGQPRAHRRRGRRQPARPRCAGLGHHRAVLLRGDGYRRVLGYSGFLDDPPRLAG
jgi:hypothetical protein